jgi:hypothetical protein
MVGLVMIIVSGHLVVDPAQRDAYLDTCREVVDAARTTDGCLDFAISADLQDPARIRSTQVLTTWPRPRCSTPSLPTTSPNALRSATSSS